MQVIIFLVYHDCCCVSTYRSIRGSVWVEPCEFWENSHTKRRMHNLLCASGYLDHLEVIKARKATKAEILRFHTERYHDQIELESSGHGGEAGEVAPFSGGAYDIACLSAGGVISATEAVLAGRVRNAYCLVRPPGHHAEADRGRGFCLFNNVVLAALHARTVDCGSQQYCRRIAIVDYDVHHGNGTQDAFWNDPDCLFISIHQDSNYPNDTGSYKDIGGENAKGSTINVPLPPGSGTGAYAYTFRRIVIPALERFKPDMIFVSSGFDAAYVDPLARMMLSSSAFKDMAASLVQAADSLCSGRIVFAHEGGYSKDYVPFCGLAVLEALAGIPSAVIDHNLPEVNRWGYQDCQPHQAFLINTIADLHDINSLTVDPPIEDSDSRLVADLQMLLDAVPDAGRRQHILQSLRH